MKDVPDYIVINRASGRMITHSVSKIQVREFEPIIADEPPSRGGEDQGPTPLDYLMVSLCA